MAIKQFNERKDTLVENEDHLAKGLPNLDGSDDEYDESSDDDNDEKEFTEIKDKLKKMNNGQPIDDENFEDDDEDSDYEVEGDDMGLYDSNLDDVDELLHLKETVDTIHQGNSQYFAQLSQMMTPDELNKLAETLNNAQELKEREEKCTAAIDELEKKIQADQDK